MQDRPSRCPVALKRTPEDFVVEEIPAYAPCGQGDHLYVTFRKTGLTTDEAVRHLAQRLGVSPRDAGVAGIKDKVAVTTQTVSFLAPAAVVPPPPGELAPGLVVLAAARHGNKLKPGHLAGNRFRIALPLLTTDAALIQDAVARLEVAGREGAPNAFGQQRFGREGDNFERAAAFVRGETRPPRDKHKVRFLFSALQSELFNRVLDRRLADGTWTTVLAGDLAKKTDSGGLFLVEPEGLEEATARAARGEIAATGPMFGASMRAPSGAPAALEAEVLASSGVTAEQLAAFRHAGEGTRRALRVLPERLDCRYEPEAARLVVELTLPKGAYATTFLSWACKLHEARSEAPADAPSDP